MSDLRQLAEELRSFGVDVDLKRLNKNPEVFHKKLNHLKARKNMADNPPSPGRRRNNYNQDNDDDDDEEEEVEEADVRPRTRGFAVEKTVTEQKTRRRTVHEFPASATRQSPSRRSGVPVPAGPIMNREDRQLDVPSTSAGRSPGRRSMHGVPIAAGPKPPTSAGLKPTNGDKAKTNGKAMRTAVSQLDISDSEEEEEEEGTNGFSASRTEMFSQRPATRMSGFGQQSYLSGATSKTTAAATSVKQISGVAQKKSTPSRMDFSDSDGTDGEYTFREVASAGVNTSGAWKDASRDDTSRDGSRFGSFSLFGGGASKPSPGGSTTTRYGAGLFSDDSMPLTTIRQPAGDAGYPDRISSRFGNPPSAPVSSTWSAQKVDAGTTRIGGGGRGAWGERGAWVGRRASEVVSKGLFVLPVALFVVLAGLYVNLRLGSNLDSGAAYNFMACDGSGKPKCLTGPEVEDMKKSIGKLMEFLSKRAGDFDCEHQKTSRYLKVEECKLHLKQNEQDFDKTLEILQLNPSWQIKMLDSDGKPTVDFESVALLESEPAAMGIFCRLQLAVSRVFFRLFALIIGLVSLMVVVLLIRLWFKRKAAQTKELHHLVEDIIGVIKNHAAEYKINQPGPLPCLPVPHVRDSLIPLKDRKSKQGLWNQAVRFLSANESRVREEMQLVDGEETLCWKWIETYTDPLLTSGRDKSRSSVSGFDSRALSSCLKICNLLPPNGKHADINLSEIRDAILDRCGTIHGILHLAVDQHMPDCVYIKCVSASAAGQNYKVLHGWSYKGQLVSVQYVGESLYRAIFPDSTDAMVTLRSSLATSKRQSVSSYAASS